MYTFLLFFAANPEGGGNASGLIFLAAIFLVFYLFIIRPQSKKQKEIQNKVAAIKKGDKIVTSGGIVGLVTSIDDDSVMLEIDKDVKVKLLKNAIVDVNPQK
ncbi:preprotein translocase subunit YajC [Balneolaceae bacterium ANBcel3]|nr:preprotein translocase subunit YajC [Balneolaceae bacterium ANBcel3]